MTDLNSIAVISAMGVNVIALLAGLIKLHSIANHVQRTFDYFAKEHEMLMEWYAKSNGIALHEIPTRLSPAPWFKKF
jgi:hypothetical protein